MKKGKNFFYRVDAADFLSAVFQVSEGDHKAWVSQLAIDLVSGVGTTDYSIKLIEEANEYRATKAKAGQAGGIAKAGKS